MHFFIWTNFNELDAHWLLERFACLWVTKPWETTLSRHSKNVLTLFSRYLKCPLPKIYLLISFKFAVLAANAYKCLCMSLQSAWVTFMKFYKIFIIVIEGMVVFYDVIGTQCPWNFVRFSEFWGGKWVTFRYRLFIVHWYSIILSELSHRSKECMLI